jgi:hypothetical protein
MKWVSWLLAVSLSAQAADSSFLVWDIAGQKIEYVEWKDSGRSIPVGSLVKPFLAQAYFEIKGAYPEMKCPGGESCWLPAGHGWIGIVDAIAQSCNFYFHRLEVESDRSAVAGLAQRYGLTVPTEGASLIGLGPLWKVLPADLVRAYGELLKRSQEPGVRPILRGMALSASMGTGKGTGGNVLSKTGTAPCVHMPRASGDGYAIVLYPAETARKVVLIQMHNAPGAEAAARWPGILEKVTEKLAWPH